MARTKFKKPVDTIPPHPTNQMKVQLYDRVAKERNEAVELLMVLHAAFVVEGSEKVNASKMRAIRKVLRHTGVMK